LSDIYAYLRARADNAIGHGRPENFPKVKPATPAAAAPAPEPAPKG